MARKNKIEQHGLEQFVYDLLAKDKDTPHVEIARLCSEKAGTSISNMAVKRFLEKEPEPDPQMIRVIKEDKRRVVKVFNQHYQIIESQLEVSQRMFNQLAELDDFPDRLEKMHQRLVEVVEKNTDIPTVLIYKYYDSIKDELCKHLNELALVNREVRENNKFLMQLQEKIYEYSLVQEFVKIFLDEFKQESPEAHQRVVAKLAANPKLRKIVEEQKHLRGEA